MSDAEELKKLREAVEDYVFGGLTYYEFTVATLGDLAWVEAMFDEHSTAWVSIAALMGSCPQEAPVDTLRDLDEVLTRCAAGCTYLFRKSDELEGVFWKWEYKR